MVGKTIRIRGSNLKVLPNPTRGPWHDSFSCTSLMKHFIRNINHIDQGSHPSHQVVFIRTSWKNLLEPVWRHQESEIDIDMREATHDVLNSCDEYLKSEDCGEAVIAPIVGAHVAIVLEELVDQDSLLSTLDSDQEGALMDHYFQAFRPRLTEVAERREHESPVTITAPDTTLVSRDDIWLTLLFRMCCWWVLHEFDKTDAVALPPRWKGSRMCVMVL